MGEEVRQVEVRACGVRRATCGVRWCDGARCPVERMLQRARHRARRDGARRSVACHAGQVPPMFDAQGDEIRMVDAKLFGDGVDLAFLRR